MPQYFDCDIPMARRSDGKDLKVFRYNPPNYGPSVISKYVCDMGSHYTIKQLITQDGSLNYSPQVSIPPPLQKSDQFGLEAFSVLYSVNKRDRWEIMDMARDNIASLQDSSMGLRVTVMSLPLYGGSAEGRRNQCYRSWLSEYHTVDHDGRVVSKQTGRTVFKGVSRPENPPLHKKRRRIRPLLEHPVDEFVSKVEQDKIPVWERDLHVIYQEQHMYMPNRKANTERPMLYYKKLFPKRRPKNARLRKEDLISLTSPSVELRDIYANDDECDLSTSSDSLHSIRLSLADCICSPQKRMRAKKKKHSRDVDYETWLSFSPSNENSSQSNEHADEVTSSEDVEVMPLKSFLIRLEPGVDLSSFAQSIAARQIERLHPRSFIVDSTERLRRYADSELPEEFSGIAILQHSSTDITGFIPVEIVKCILNEGVMQYGAPSSMKYIPTISSLIPFLPASSIANTESLAESVAFETLLKPGNCSHKILKNVTCGKCQGTGTISLRCGHLFCEPCWMKHSELQLKLEIVPVTCPSEGCDGVLELDHMLRILPLRECYRYRGLVVDRLAMKPRWHHCPNCSRFILVKGTTAIAQTVAHCDCGFVMCLRCRAQAHIPASCQLAHQYRAICHPAGEYVGPLPSVCPACRTNCVLMNHEEAMTRRGDAKILTRRCLSLSNHECHKVDLDWQCRRRFNYMLCDHGSILCQKHRTYWRPVRANGVLQDMTYEVKNELPEAGPSPIENFYLPQVRTVKLLGDRPPMNQTHFPKVVFYKCILLKIARSYAFRKDLHRLRLPTYNKKRAVNVTVSASEVLEMLQLHIATLSRWLKTREGVSKSSLQFHLNTLKSQSSSVLFLVSTLRAVCECTTVDLHGIDFLVESAEHRLRLLLKQAVR